MAFYLESQYLDLKKSYQNFQYESIASKEQIQALQREQPPSENPYEGISQNTYLFVQEKDTLTTDIQNLCLYFRYL